MSRMKEAGFQTVPHSVWWGNPGLLRRVRHLAQPQGENQMRTDDAETTAQAVPCTSRIGGTGDNSASLWLGRG